MADAQQPPRIELYKRWKEIYGGEERGDIVEVIGFSSGEVTYRDMNSGDAGTKGKMTEADFRKKFKPYLY